MPASEVSITRAGVSGFAIGSGLDDATRAAGFDDEADELTELAVFTVGAARAGAGFPSHAIALVASAASSMP
jgi:hypothetical protein